MEGLRRSRRRSAAVARLASGTAQTGMRHHAKCSLHHLAQAIVAWPRHWNWHRGDLSCVR
jgi:hypothetical protein